MSDYQPNIDLHQMTTLNRAMSAHNELQTRYDAAHSELVRMTEQLAACRSAANELKQQRDHYKEMDALHIESLGLKSAELAEVTQQRDELLKDAKRARYMLKHASWYRCDIDQITQLVIGVPYGSDLSCYAMRIVAIDAAMKEQK